MTNSVSTQLKYPVPKRSGTSLLFSDHPIVLDPLLAQLLGLHEAIILQQIHYWLIINYKNYRNIKEGRVWVYNSYAEWHSQIPCLSTEQIKRAMLALEKRRIVISKKFECRDWQQRKWYTIDYERLSGLQVAEIMDCAKLPAHSCDSNQSNGSDYPNEKASVHEQKNNTETTSETSPNTTTTYIPGIERISVWALTHLWRR